MDRKNLNWRVPTPLADCFDEMVMGRWGDRGKWIGAAAAMLMYLDADEKTREEYCALASSMTGNVVPENVKAKLVAGPKYSKPIGPPKATPAKKKTPKNQG